MTKLTFILILSVLSTCISAQLTAPTRNYNVTSPVPNGPYVVDRILPCTYHLFSDVDSSSLKLSILLKVISTPDIPSSPSASTTGNAKAEPSAVAPPAAVAAATPGTSSSSSLSSSSSSSSYTNGTTKQQDIIITENADVSKTEASAKHAGNLTYYEHSINYKIPQTVRPGRYNVIFYDKSTNTELDVPIEIRSAALSQPTTGSGHSFGSTNNEDKSMFAASAIKTMAPPLASSFSISFLCVFIAAMSAASALI